MSNVTPGSFMAVAGSVPIAMTLAATVMGLYVQPSARTMRLLHNLASGMLLGTVSENLFPDMMARSLQTPANKIGTALGFGVAALMAVVVDESQEAVQRPDPVQRREAAIVRSDYEGLLYGTVCGAVLFERRRDTLSLSVMVAVACGLKQFVNVLLASQTPGAPLARRDRAAIGLSSVTDQAAAFAVALAIVPLTARSLPPVYSLLMAFVATQALALSLDDSAASSLGRHELGLAARDYADTTLFFVGLALVIGARWINETTNDLSRVRRGGGARIIA